MVVAMHKDLRLGQIVGEQGVKYGTQGGALFFVERTVEMARYIPIGEKLQFAL